MEGNHIFSWRQPSRGIFTGAGNDHGDAAGLMHGPCNVLFRTVQGRQLGELDTHSAFGLRRAEHRLAAALQFDGLGDCIIGLGC
ncbi:MAG: hypothetical protein RSA54_10110, partial [Glutamicibacter sp.]